MKHIIYKITNTINNKFYVGIHSTNKLKDGYYGSGKLVLQAIQKYGKGNFTKEILAILPDRETALDIEEYVVNKEMIERDDCYNVIIGGTGVGCGKNHPRFGSNHSEETKNMIGSSLKGKMSGKNNPMWGKTYSLTKEHKEKIRKALSGKPKPWMKGKNNPSVKNNMSGENHPMFGKEHTEETKEKMRGPRPSMKGKNNPMYGKELSKNHKKQISNSLLGRKLSKETKEKICRNHPRLSGKEHPNSIKVKHIPTGNIFNTIGEAADHAGLSGSHFSWKVKEKEGYDEYEILD